MMNEDVLENHYGFKDSDAFKLRFSRSSLPQTGMGLFARDTFSKGELITEYYRSITTAEQSESEILTNRTNWFRLIRTFAWLGEHLPHMPMTSSVSNLRTTYLNPFKNT
jgi:hypothetical protein